MQRPKGTSFMSELQYIDIEFRIWYIYNIFSTFSKIVFLFFSLFKNNAYFPPYFKSLSSKRNKITKKFCEIIRNLINYT